MTVASARRPDSQGQDGYTLIGLLIAVAIVNIALAVAVTSWRSLDTRARETELIWRGEQIARAIGCHAATEASEPLEQLEQLVESNCLRRVYRDPLSPDGEWRILRQVDVTDGTIAALQGQPAPDASTAPAAAAGGTTGTLGSSGAPAAIGTGATVGSSLQQSVGVERPVLLGGLSSGTLGAGVSGANTIVGVMSQKTGEATRLYRTFGKYEAWLFLGPQPSS